MNILDIKENPKNPRVVKGSELASLQRMIQHFPKMMELRPIVISEDKTILGGNMRFSALKVLGYTEIPDRWVVIAKNFTDEQKKRFALLDNLHFGEWDFDKIEEIENVLLESVDFYLKKNKKKNTKSKSKKNEIKEVTCPKCGKTW